MSTLSILNGVRTSAAPVKVSGAGESTARKRPDFSAIGIVNPNGSGYAAWLSPSQIGNVLARLAKIASANKDKLPAETVATLASLLAEIDASRVGFTQRALNIRKDAPQSMADAFVAALRTLTKGATK